MSTAPRVPRSLREWIISGTSSSGEQTTARSGVLGKCLTEL